MFRTTPKRIEWVGKNECKVVAIGCGGYQSWNGGFTLLLTDDNRLFCCGGLGNVYSSVPVRVGQQQLQGRHILSISAGEEWAAVVVSRATKASGEK